MLKFYMPLFASYSEKIKNSAKNFYRKICDFSQHKNYAKNLA